MHDKHAQAESSCAPSAGEEVAAARSAKRAAVEVLPDNQDMGEFTLSGDLYEAYLEATKRSTPELEPVLLIASYLEALAKHRGVFDQLDQEEDSVVGRVFVPRGLSALFSRVLKSNTDELSSDAIRSSLYSAIVAVADQQDLRARINKRHIPSP